MSVRDLLEQHGVDVGDRAAVFRLLQQLPLAPRSRVEMWFEYARAQGFEVTADQRAALSA